MRTGHKIAAVAMLWAGFTASSWAVSSGGVSLPATKTATAAPAAADRVDVNHASVAELETVPGMTPTWATRIVRYRPYRTKQDLVDQGIVSRVVYERIFVIAHRNK
jgi:DNA uptake protein ComE-like DNA-binding protein